MCIPCFMIEAIENEKKSIIALRTLFLFVNKFTPQISSFSNSFESGLDRMKFCNEQLRRHEKSDKMTKHRHSMKKIK